MLVVMVVALVVVSAQIGNNSEQKPDKNIVKKFSKEVPILIRPNSIMLPMTTAQMNSMDCHLHLFYLKFNAFSTATKKTV